MALGAFLKALTVGLAGGALCAWLGTPLPWLLGALFGCAAANMGGAGLAAPVAVRQAGQWVIGAGLGLYFTPQVIERLLALAPYVAVGVVYAILLGFAFSWCLARFGNVDRATAFFAGAIGGASEMAVQGERMGGSVQLIAAAHALRVLLVVSLLPCLYQWLGVQGSDVWAQGAARVDTIGFVKLVAVTVAAGVLCSRARLPNAWVIGPMLAGALVTATGHDWTVMPGWVVVAGQLLIGISLGTRFGPDFFARAPRYLSVVAASTLAGIALSAAFGLALAHLSGIAPATMILATAPGGIAEMSLTAKVLQLGVPVVAVFHVVRYMVLVITISWLYRHLPASGHRIAAG